MEHVALKRETGTVFLDAGSRQTANINQTFFRLDVIEAGEVCFSGYLSRNIDGLYRFGSEADNEIVIKSRLGIVSRHHGVIHIQNSHITIEDVGSTNGIFVNAERVALKQIAAGDVVSVGQVRPDKPYIELKFSVDCSSFSSLNIQTKEMISIGRAKDNDVVLNLPCVSAYHAKLTRGSRGKWIIDDLGSFNGTFVNARPVIGSVEIAESEIIQIANASLMIKDGFLYHDVRPDGVEIITQDLVKTRPIRGGRRTVTDHVSLKIDKGEFVAIIGGSGAGKTTLMNEINGSSPADSGTVSVNGIDLYAHYGILKNSIGYVPQQDIVYDNLKLIDMLVYEAELRMPPDYTKQERISRAREVLEMLGLSHEANNFVKSLSGGQKKRASIAVELLADPKLLFLDEPTSGLDPGTEKNLMCMLADMAHSGRTIVLVTHTTQNISLCDRVIMLGSGGRLCYAGKTKGAYDFFGVDVFTDIYNKVEENPKLWADSFKQKSARLSLAPTHFTHSITKKRCPSVTKQFWTLTKRLNKLILNDVPRLLLLVGQAPLLGALIALVSGSECFNLYEDAKAGMFALLCACIWIGLLNSIQEVCKERAVLEREYAGGLNLFSYILSKVVVLGFMCVLQSVLLLEVFIAICGIPSACLMNTHAEMLLTVFLTTFSSMCIGLIVSSIFNNSDRALAMAPLLIMPQVLFSGFLFKLEGVMEKVSYIVQCKWGMEALGTTADFNGMDLKIYENEMITPDVYEHEWEAAFDFTVAHLVSTWGILVLFSVVSLAICYFALKISLNRAK